MASFLNVLSIIGATVFMVFFFGLCIFVHELGHFLAAKWRGLKVTAFSIGFRKIWGKTWNGVEYRIGWIPFGGYVEIPQVDGDGAKVKDENGNDIEIPAAKPLDRMITVVAGPLFNIIFGFLIGTIIWIVGIPQDTPNLKEIEVAAIKFESPEYKAGLRAGDVIVKLNGKAINTSWNGVFKEILTTIGPVRLTVRGKDGKMKEISYVPAINNNVLPDEGIAYPFFLPKLPLIVYPGKESPAWNAGVRKGDKVLAVNGERPTSIEEFEIMIDHSNGKPITLLIERNGKELTVENVKPLPHNIAGERGTWKVGVTYSPAAAKLAVLDVKPGSAAEKAGLKKDDIIKTINGKAPVPKEFPLIIQAAKGQPMVMEVIRKVPKDKKAAQGEKPSKTEIIEVVETTLKIELKADFIPYYTIGVKYAYISHPTPWDQFAQTISLTWKSMRAIGYSIGGTLGLTEQQTTVKPKHMSGPVGIGRILYRSVYDGSLMQGLNIVVLITFSLGLLNLLPFPVLDGGHFVLALLEIIFRKPIPEKYLNPISYAFVAIIIAFMLFVTFYDAKRVIGDLTPKTPPTNAVKPGK
ncbi:MAG: site-2 protease family protein [Lentisphaeria bacterium]|nr:site-2 protease family protein [Lentisphaeria bacterium]